MTDASRGVGVVSSLLSQADRGRVWEETKEKYASLRASRSGGGRKARVTLGEARAAAFKADWKKFEPKKPSFIGARTIDDVSLEDVLPFIDWTPFFMTWDLKGRYPQILQDDKRGEAARGLWNDAQAMLEKLVQEKWLTLKAAVGFWPANADGDDIVLWANEDRHHALARLHTLRQQIKKDDANTNYALSDFVRPNGMGSDWLGGFCVTAGHGELERSDAYKRANDDYNAIMVKALADRFAEGFAEFLHARVRRELWGYAPDESLSREDMIAEKYAGIRPAPGYPAQPDHTEKETLFKLLDAPSRAGVELTTSFAMTPPASVSGFYFAHPQSHYFSVGRIESDQVEDYAKRKGWDVSTAERWLGSILNYAPISKAG